MNNLNEKITDIANKFSIKPIEKIKNRKMEDNNILSIAERYKTLENNPSNNDVKKAYRQFKRELIAQYRELSKVIKFEYVENNPYDTSEKMFNDIEENNRLKVYLGGEYHPSMRGLNKIFRAVHDILGHYINKNSFSNNGEYLAYLHHKQTFSPLAIKALFTETIGQNSYYKVNNSYAKQVSAIYEDKYINMV